MTTTTLTDASNPLPSTELIFEITGVGDFRGQLNAAGSEAVGRWSQGGAEYPITLVKESDPALVGEQAAAGRHVRPQQPSDTPPYHVHDFVVPVRPEAQWAAL